MNDFTLSVMDFFGDNKKDFKKVANASRVVNVFNGLLDLEVSAWGDYFYTVFLNDSAFVDAKYGDKIASLLCISSDEEYQQSLDRMETINDIFSSEGSIGDFLSVINESLDENVGALEKKCEELLKQLDGSNLSVYRYNKSYQELEDALETQQQFLNTGGFIMDVEDSVTDMTGKFDFFGQAFTGLDLLCKFGEVVGYVSEFQNQDQFTTDALSTYLSKRKEIAGNVPNGAVIAMMLSTASMESNVVVYSAYEYFKNNISDILNEMAKGSSLSSICLAEVQLAKFAWNFISQNVPFYSEGLSQTDAFETSLYTYIFETDMWKTYDARRKVILGNKDTLTSSYLYELAQLCYIYLKSCYIVQNTTLASIGEYLSDGNIKKLENNCDTLVEYMAILKSADTVTDEKYKGLLYGFLPENNAIYLNEYDADALMGLFHDESENNIIDIQNYWKDLNLEKMASDLGDSTEESENYIYSSENFYISRYELMNSDIPYMYSVRNYGDDRIAIFGCYIGEPVDNLIQALKKEGCVYNKQGFCMAYTSTGTYYISYQEQDGNLSSWEVSNGGGEGSSLHNLMDMLELGYNLYDNEREGWKREICDFVISEYGDELEKASVREFDVVNPYIFNEYSICYINDDNIPELVVVDKDSDIVSDGYSSIWFSDSGKALQYSIELTGVLREYMEKENMIYSISNADSYTQDTIYNICDKEAISVRSGEARWVGTTYFYMDGRDVSYDEYRALINECLIPETKKVVNYVDASSVLQMILEF